MKKIIYFLITSLFAFSFIACEDEESLPDISGSWTYESPHFEFGYTQDTVRIMMGKAPIKMAVKDIKTSFVQLAGEKMGEYFQGVTFKEQDRLEIRMRMGDQTEQILHAVYGQSANYIGVELDSNDMKALTNGAVSQIPKISFRYGVQENHMEMYFNKDYIQLVYQMMADQLLNMLIENVMHQDPATFPEAARKNITDQIDTLFKNTLRLEIGFNLKR